MITFEHVEKRYPDGTVAIGDLSFTAATGQLTTLVGPSGCGKTTSLRMINRLIQPTGGRILLDGEPTLEMDLIALRRRIGYVIQHVGLFPHRTIVDNVATTARLAGIGKRAARTRAGELLERVGLAPDLADRYPWQLSGGQQQRVGVARALAADPDVLLMDEPFSAVDPVVRAQLQQQFLQLQRELGKTIVMVTHDIDEALTMGDQIAVFRTGGDLVRLAPPEELLRDPGDAFVAEFVGGDRGYRSLGYVHATSLTIDDEHALVVGADRTAGDSEWRPVVDAAGIPLGWVGPGEAGPVLAERINVTSTPARRDDSLRRLLNAALSAPDGRGIVVDGDGRYAGTVALAEVTGALTREHGTAARA